MLNHIIVVAITIAFFVIDVGVVFGCIIVFRFDIDVCLRFVDSLVVVVAWLNKQCFKQLRCIVFDLSHSIPIIKQLGEEQSVLLGAQLTQLGDACAKMLFDSSGLFIQKNRKTKKLLTLNERNKTFYNNNKEIIGK